MHGDGTYRRASVARRGPNAKHEEGLGVVGRPSADLTGKDGGAEEKESGRLPCLWTARYCGQVATAPPDPLPTVLSSIF